MSNTLAVAAVTATLRHLLEESLAGPEPGPVGSAVVTTLRPDQIVRPGGGGNALGINVFLYEVTPNHAWDLTDLPTRDADGGLVRTPLCALDLHYLISFQGGGDAGLESQRLLARAKLALAVTPVLTRPTVAAMIDKFRGDPDLGFLAESDLGRQPELVKLAPTVLSLEELSRLWGILGTPYLLSVTYRATVVLLQPQLVPKPVLPVRRPVVAAVAGPPMRLSGIEGEPVGTGSTVVLVGVHLLPGSAATSLRVQIGPVEVAPAAGSTTDRVRVVIGANVPAGVHTVRTVARQGAGSPPGERVTARSNAVALIVRPQVAVSAVDAATVRLGLTPPAQPGQEVRVTADRLDGGAPPVLEFTVPDAPGPRDELTLDRARVPDGRWRIQVRVDGVDSLPVATGETYLGPELVLP